MLRVPQERREGQTQGRHDAVVLGAARVGRTEFSDDSMQLTASSVNAKSVATDGRVLRHFRVWEGPSQLTNQRLVRLVFVCSYLLWGCDVLP